MGTATQAQLKKAGWKVERKGRSFYDFTSPAGEHIEVDYVAEQEGPEKWLVDLAERRDGFSCRTLGSAQFVLLEFYTKQARGGKGAKSASDFCSRIFAAIA
jgi:hypothetical protein